MLLIEGEAAEACTWRAEITVRASRIIQDAFVRNGEQCTAADENDDNDEQDEIAEQTKHGAVI